MPSLDDVTQTFTADVGPYVAAVQVAIDETKRFADAVKEAGGAAAVFGADTKIAAAMLNSLEDAETMLMGISNLLSASLDELGDAVRSLEQSEMYAYGATEALDHILGEATQQTASLAMIERLLAESLQMASRSMDIQIATLLALDGALDTMSKSATRAAATSAAAGGIIAQWWSQWGSVVHWVVMTTLEIAATALPAVVALGAALAAQYETWGSIYDRMNALYTASGSLAGAFRNSVGPLQAMGEAGLKLQDAVKPDVFIIFGSVINSLVGHVGAFSQIAQQASNVLAQFAAKLSSELAGPLGSQVTGFFSNAVGYMIQWGQVLGNLGHVFVNVMDAFWGSSHVLLGVLDEISRVLVALTGNPVIAWLIGLASAASAVYRWGKLLYDAFKWMGGEAAFAGLKAAISYVTDLGATFLILAEDVGFADAAMAIFEALLGPEVFFVIAVSAALTALIMSQHQAATSTQNLINSINKMNPSMANFSLGMQLMEGNLLSLYNAEDKLNTKVITATTGYNRFGTAQEDAALKVQVNNTAIKQSVNEMSKLANETVDLVTGLAQAGQRTGALGADMNAMSIQTAISDSKIQSVNQALDQYIGLLTSGTAGNADFITSMSNIGSVSATTTNNLGTNTVQLSLNTRTFAKALTDMGTVGAAAWQNFDQVLTGSMQPLMDNLRTLGVTGALTGHQVSQAAIDMASTLGQYAGSNKTAQASIMGFLAAQGLTYPSFQKFMADAKASGADQNQLNGIINAGTIAFSKLSSMAKQAAQAMNPMVASAIDAAALKSSGFNGALTKLQTDMMNHAPAAAIQSDLAGVNSDLQTALKQAETTGNGIGTSATTAASGVHQASSQMQSSWDQAKLKALSLQNQVMTSGGSISSHSASAAGGVRSAMSQMSGAFDSAKAHAQSLQNYIDSMHGKTISVNTVFSSTSGPSVGSPAAGFGVGIQRFHGGIAGYAGGGIAGGGMGYDAIPAWLTKGEGILTNAAVSALGGPLAIRALNDAPGRVLGGGGGGGGTSLGLNLVIQNKMDGQTVNTNQRQATLIYNRRNPQNNLGLRTR